MSLPPDRLNRFARHIVLPEVGGAGQVALSEAHVVLIGCGGIGSPALQYLAAAGIGRLTLIDSDVVEESNLQRQTIFTPADIGLPKANVAAEWVRRFDPAIETHAVVERVGKGSTARITDNAHLVLDGCDNFATRLVVSDACVKAGVPLTSAAIGRFQGQVANFAGHLPGQPCYRCFVGDAFDSDDCDTCAEQGIIGPLAATMGSFGALLALCAIVGAGEDVAGNLFLFDALSVEWRKIRLPKDPRCKACG